MIITFGANGVIWFGGANGVPGNPDGCNKLGVYPPYDGTPNPVRKKGESTVPIFGISLNIGGNIDGGATAGGTAVGSNG